MKRKNQAERKETAPTLNKGEECLVPGRAGGYPSRGEVRGCKIERRAVVTPGVG